MNINWESAKSHLLLNERLPKKTLLAYQQLHAAAPDLPAHLWLASSGTSGKFKLIALAKQALLSSAAAVNLHLSVTAADVWCLSLPTFHVGGLGVLARAHLSGARVCEFVGNDYDKKWDANSFIHFCKEQQVSLAALVPTQLYDLLASNHFAPKSLRAVLIGGGALSGDLYQAARRLGWNVLPTYGMTECSSQIATAELASLQSKKIPQLKVLPHFQVGKTAAGFLQFKGPALFSAMLSHDENGEEIFSEHRQTDWFVSEDKGSFDGINLTVEGRGEEFVKISGESVDLNSLEQQLDTLKLQIKFNGDAAIIPIQDKRLGAKIALVTSGTDKIQSKQLFTEYNKIVPAFARSKDIYVVESIPRSDLGKVFKNKLRALIMS